LLKPIKIVLRQIQEIIERNLVSLRLQQLIWRTRHFYRIGWAEDYLKSVDHYHRKQIASAVKKFKNIKSIIEVGCGSAPNLINLRQQFPHLRLLGIDINRRAIEVAKNYFSSKKEKNIELKVGNIDKIELLTKSVDVVLTDAVLMFIPPDQIVKVLKELCRIANKGLIFNEYNKHGLGKEGYFDGGRWVYDFKFLLKKLLPKSKIKLLKSSMSKQKGAWEIYGCLIEVRL
jgi:ubiquinone/menaquinone biosynthesis C-methylase UbiE